MALCVTIHAMGLTVAFRWLNRHATRVEAQLWPATWLLIRIAGWTLLLHLVQILLWAAFYAWQGDVLRGPTGSEMPDFTTAAYFSAVTYTTTGYGDFVLKEEWRLVGGAEALTGILMCGLSAGMFFAVFSKVFRIDSANPPTE